MGGYTEEVIEEKFDIDPHKFVNNWLENREELIHLNLWFKKHEMNTSDRLAELLRFERIVYGLTLHSKWASIVWEDTLIEIDKYFQDYKENSQDNDIECALFFEHVFKILVKYHKEVQNDPLVRGLHVEDLDTVDWVKDDCYWRWLKHNLGKSQEGQNPNKGRYRKYRSFFPDKWYKILGKFLSLIHYQIANKSDTDIYNELAIFAKEINANIGDIKFDKMIIGEVFNTNGFVTKHEFGGKPVPRLETYPLYGHDTPTQLELFHNWYNGHFSLS